MALAFMLNPRKARGTKRKARVRRRARRKPAPRSRRAPKWMSKKVKDMTFTQCMAAAAYRKRGYKCRTAIDKKIAVKARAAARKVASLDPGYGDPMGVMQTNNPRGKTRGKNGGRKMARTRRRPRRKAVYRSKSGRFTKSRSGRKLRRKRGPRNGYHNNPKRRRNARRRRNVWTNNAAGHRKAARLGWSRRRAKSKKRSGGRRRKNPVSTNPRRRRRRNGMYSGRLYANPRKRRRNTRGRRRRNPMAITGTLGGIFKKLTDPKALMQFGVAAAGGAVSEMLGRALASKVTEYAGETFADPKGMPAKLLGAAARIATGLLVASFIPARFQTAFVLGAGAMAAQPLVSGLLEPVLTPIGEALGVKPLAGFHGGIGGWISAAEVHGMRGLRGQRPGMGAWLSAQQLPGVGVAGVGRGVGAWGGHYNYQPGMQAAFTM